MVTQQQISLLKNEIDCKGYALNCPPDDFKFMTHNNSKLYLDALSTSLFDEEIQFESVELDAPWGNCVAIYKCEKGIREKAIAALNKYADAFSKESGIPRVWK